MTSKINWQAAYASLHDIGYTDKQVADMAGLSRYVINRVRLGRYTRNNHEPGYEGGQRVVDAISGALREGVLDADPLAQEPEESPC